MTVWVEVGCPKREDNGNQKLPQSANAKTGNDVPDHRFDLLKMEYDKAAERYENIYRAVWQNFSYLSIVSAAILTFGSNQLPMWITVSVAGFPLLFWFWFQFIPLDAYGRDLRLRLRDIEAIFNRDYFKYAPSDKDQAAGSNQAPKKRGLWSRLLGKFPEQGANHPPSRIAHFTEFTDEPRSDCWPGWSTRGGILLSAFIAHLAWIGAAVCLGYVSGFHVLKEPSKQEVNLTANVVGSTERQKQEVHLNANVAGSVGQSSPAPSARSSNSPSSSANPVGSSTASPSNRPTQTP